MNQPADPGYNPASLVGPLDIQKVQQLEQYFRDSGMAVAFDPAYIEHLSMFHGGVPKKRCFKSVKGNDYVIERFLNFIDHKADKVLGWYNVEVTWGLIMDRLNDYLIPFADLFAGNFLCFDYEGGGRPKIVVWRHEDSRQDKPATEFVAANFDEFLTKLYELSQPCDVAGGHHA